MTAGVQEENGIGIALHGGLTESSNPQCLRMMQRDTARSGSLGRKSDGKGGLDNRGLGARG